MLVGDIYGGRDYAAIGLSATTIASSFGKIISQASGANWEHCLCLCFSSSFGTQIKCMTAFFSFQSCPVSVSVFDSAGNVVV